jgi:cytochrome c oxidase cbb3-type subunit 3
MSKVYKDPITGVETTGHVWDDTLMEFNNPLPMWWIWTFYATVIFAIVYWVIYPSWPSGLAEKGYFIGTSEITYKNDANKEVTTHWNTRALLAHEMQNDENELKRKKYLKEVAAMSYDDIAKDSDKSSFVRSYGKGIFGDYCAACHQTGGQGVIGHYPNLVDDAWLWGGSAAEIQTTISNGRKGNMPSFAKTLSDTEITNVANFVLSLSGTEHDVASAKEGKLIFNGKGGCMACHTPAGTGLAALGSANLTDKIWTQADVPHAKDKVAVISAVVKSGIQREMPAWKTRLSEDEIKVLVAYVKLLSAE